MTKKQYYMKIARTVAERGTCPKEKVGAVLIKDDHIISTGYNGAPSGVPHCNEVGCKEVDNHCQRAVHAELNVLLQAAYHGQETKGSILYSTHLPCNLCLQALKNAGVETIYYDKPYKNQDNYMCVYFKIYKII